MQLMRDASKCRNCKAAGAILVICETQVTVHSLNGSETGKSEEVPGVKLGGMDTFVTRPLMSMGAILISAMRERATLSASRVRVSCLLTQHLAWE
jgi:hypothetical protein